MVCHEYKCNACLTYFDVYGDSYIHCPNCASNNCKKVIRSFAYKKMFTEHFNTSVGKYVTSERDMKDELKRASDEQSRRLGTEHLYEYLSPVEMKDRYIEAPQMNEVDKVIERRKKQLKGEWK